MWRVINELVQGIGREEKTNAKEKLENEGRGEEIKNSLKNNLLPSLKQNSMYTLN